VVRLTAMQGQHEFHRPEQARHVAHGARGSAGLHAGVASFMNGVYLWMAAGIGVTAAVAGGLAASPEAMGLLYGTGLRWVVLFAPLVFVFVMRGRMETMSPQGAVVAFLVFAGLMGLTLAYVPLMFTTVSIVSALLSTVGMFAAMSVFGWITKRDLSGMGRFLIMALFGVIIASIVNMFVGSVGAHMAIDVLVLVIFAGLTAWDTQNLKQVYLAHGNTGNIAVIGALHLYLDFINIFISLLHLFGDRE
jgi:uncharacterized protein